MPIMPFENIPTFYLPPNLTDIASELIVRLLVYEDYEDCNFYRWDPVKIWEFETHQPKKKKNKNLSPIDNTIYGHPPPPWKELIKFKNWWCKESLQLLGHLIDSPIRKHIVNAFEKQSWTSQSSEEDVLFLLLRLCIDTQVHFSSRCLNPIRSFWIQDLALIIDNLGPYPLRKLTVEDDIFQGNPLILSTIIRNSPYLQVLRIGHWELYNDILISLGRHCPLLTELVIDGMEPDLFMNDDAFFKCFFSGLSYPEVYECHKSGTIPPLSFKYLKYVDLLFCKQTERLIKMISYFYHKITINAVDVYNDDCTLAEPFLEIGAKIPFLRVNTNTNGLLDGRLLPFVKNSCLKELRIDIDDNFPRAINDMLYYNQISMASSKLKAFFNQVKTLDSLVLRPHEGIDMAKVTCAMFDSQGGVLKSLHLIYDFSSISLITLYQLLNLCPCLERLVLDIGIHLGCSSSFSVFDTRLKEMRRLHTLVFREVTCEEGGKDFENGPVFFTLAKCLLKMAPNLKNFCMHLEEQDEEYLALHSSSVERLHLSLSDEYSPHWVLGILPNFPNLKVVSLDGCHHNLWKERLDVLSKSAIQITKKKPEFANILSWKKKLSPRIRPWLR